MNLFRSSILEYRFFPKTLFLLLIFTLSYNSTASFSKDLTPTFDHSYSSYTKLLNENVDDGFVNYKGIIKSSEEFDQLLKSFDSVTEDQYQLWSEDQQLSFWINAYNAFTLKAIIDNYPIKRSFTFVGLFYAPSNSILQIRGVWKGLKFRILGKELTLDHIEHQILRKDFDEPRIHMAINCASIGCPDIRNEAYISSKLDSQLDDASHRYVNNQIKGSKFNLEKNEIKISKIFKWFRKDFDKYSGTIDINNSKYSGVLSFIYKYSESKDLKETILKQNLKVSSLSYDWSLNER